MERCWLGVIVPGGNTFVGWKCVFAGDGSRPHTHTTKLFFCVYVCICVCMHVHISMFFFKTKHLHFSVLLQFWSLNPVKLKDWRLATFFSTPFSWLARLAAFSPPLKNWHMTLAKCHSEWGSASIFFTQDAHISLCLLWQQLPSASPIVSGKLPENLHDCGFRLWDDSQPSLLSAVVQWRLCCCSLTFKIQVMQRQKKKL